tara:strand:- start:64 stop:300 length:237 start_codon:yes stop_codon:yes gene_type:complete
MNTFDSIMSPLGREHCMIFYYIGLFVFFVSLIGLLLGLIKLFNKKTFDIGSLIILNSLGGFFSYYLYRIAYSMCVKSM